MFVKSKETLKLPQRANIKNSKSKIAYDPFAGAGDLLNAAREQMKFKSVIGLDIDEELDWQINDSLINSPPFKGAIIITNPPYIAKQSASRKKIDLSK